MIGTRGMIPEIKEDDKKAKRLDALETIMRSSKDKLEPYMKENGGPLIGYGVNYEGYAFVEFDKKQEDNINKSTIDKLFNIIDTDAKNMNLTDVPVVFRKGEEIIPAARDSVWTNLIGGIKIVRSTGASSTLGFAAQDNSGNKGVVISGHVGKSAGIGGPIYQYYLKTNRDSNLL